jgi:acetyl-CoA carboxylase alpha subunit
VGEPIGGAHTDPAAATRLLDAALARALGEVAALDVDTRLEQRYQKFRKMGSVGILDLAADTPPQAPR